MSCVPSADSATIDVLSGCSTARPMMPVAGIAAGVPSAPLVRSRFDRNVPVWPESCSTAKPLPAAAGVLAVAVSTPGGMSKPSTLSTSEESAWHSVCVPLFGGFWMHSASVVESSVYCVVSVTFALLFVYAVSWTPVVGPLIAPSICSSRPSRCRRRTRRCSDSCGNSVRRC